MRTLQIFLAIVLTVGCTAPTKHDPVAVKEPADQGPFAGMGLRYDGYYRDSRADVLYLIRFFPEGRAVLVNGTRDVEKDLPLFLKRDIQSDPVHGLYNLMVDVRGDSMFFTTRPERGEISYRGKVMSGSTVRFHRYSHINGNQRYLEYIFSPDSVPGLKER